MVKRMPKRGLKADSRFWAALNFPRAGVRGRWCENDQLTTEREADVHLGSNELRHGLTHYHILSRHDFAGGVVRSAH